MTNWVSDRARPHSDIFLTKFNKNYSKQSVLSLVVDFVLFITLRTHIKVENGDPYLRFSFWQFPILRFGNNRPFSILKNLPLSLFRCLQPGSLLDERHKHWENIALYEQMMKNTNFQMFEIVCDVPDDGYAHDEYLELYVLNLSIQLFLGRTFQDFTHLRLTLLLLSHFR